MITEQQAFAIQVARSLTVERGADGWFCRTPRGHRVRTDPEEFATPVEALERAEAHLVAREADEEERRAGRILGELQRGEIYVRPRTISEVIDGERVERVVFDAVRTTDKLPLSEGLGSVAEAVSAAREIATPTGGDFVEAGGGRVR